MTFDEAQAGANEALGRELMSEGGVQHFVMGCSGEPPVMRAWINDRLIFEAEVDEMPECCKGLGDCGCLVLGCGTSHCRQSSHNEAPPPTDEGGRGRCRW